MSIRTRDLDFLKAVGAKQTKDVQAYLKTVQEREKRREERLARLRRASHSIKPIQTDEYAASIPKAATIFSPPSSPRTRASRASFVPRTPPKLRLPSAAELARSRAGGSKARTRGQTKTTSKQRQKKLSK